MIENSENSLLIAFATSNNVDLDAHFGSCPAMSLYRLTPDGCEHIKSVEFTAVEGHNQQKINDRLTILNGCFAVYCLACGNPVRKQLMAQGTRVVIYPEQSSIESVINHIHNNWPSQVALRQAKQREKKKQADYFETLTESEWE